MLGQLAGIDYLPKFLFSGICFSVVGLVGLEGKGMDKRLIGALDIPQAPISSFEGTVRNLGSLGSPGHQASSPS